MGAVTVFLADESAIIRAGVSTTTPTMPSQQLTRHRAEMNRAILSEGGTVMQYVGDAVMAVFGAPGSAS